MFVRPKKNASGSVSVQIISKSRGKYKVVKTLGSATTRQEIERLTRLAEQEIERLSEPLSLFSSENDILVEKFLNRFKTQVFKLWVLNWFLEKSMILSGLIR
jgi:hypothetical protein